MLPQLNPDPLDLDRLILLVMVPGMGIRDDDFRSHGLIAAVEHRQWPVTVVPVDPGAESYLDGSVEARLLDGIEAARRATGASRIWLAGISLGCQGILRCVRARPGVAEGVVLLTPYLASTGVIAEVNRTGGLQRWAALQRGRQQPDRALLTWLTTVPLPRMMMGYALDDRFALTGTLLANMMPADQVVAIPGGHDWTSWETLWRLLLDKNPFEQPAASESGRPRLATPEGVNQVTKPKGVNQVTNLEGVNR